MEHEEINKIYIIFLKRKQRETVKAKECAEGQYHQNFNHKLEPSSHFVPSCAHADSCVMNAMDYNNKLRSVIEREDDLKPTHGHGLIHKYVPHSCDHGCYYGLWLITQT